MKKKDKKKNLKVKKLKKEDLRKIKGGILRRLEK